MMGTLRLQGVRNCSWKSALSGLYEHEGRVSFETLRDDNSKKGRIALYPDGPSCVF